MRHLNTEALDRIVPKIIRHGSVTVDMRNRIGELQHDSLIGREFCRMVGPIFGLEDACFIPPVQARIPAVSGDARLAIVEH